MVSFRKNGSTFIARIKQSTRISVVCYGLFLGVFPLIPFTQTAVYAQQMSRVSGQVKDKNGLPQVNATIKVVETESVTNTDSKGNFTLTLPPGTYTIAVSHVSFAELSQQVIVKGNENLRLNFNLQDRTSALDEVVVTALGISRASKSVGYSVQQVDGSLIKESHETNLINSLSGRVAGVNITNSSGGVGASSNIQIRGQNFVSGYNYNNSPLFIVDGVPISNNNEQSTRAFTGRQDFNNPNFTGGEGEVDYGNAAGEIDPNDIASITVLKGPNAAALYGSRASNGVILITTKSGKGSKGLGISFSSNADFGNPLKLPDYQYKYGQGRYGVYSYVDGAGTDGSKYDHIIENWGPALNGQLIKQWDSPIDPKTKERVATPFVAHKNQLRDFLETSKTFTQNLSIAHSNEALNYRFSYTNMNQSGMVPNTDMHRNAVGVNAGYQLIPKLRFDVAMNWVNSGSDNRASYGAKNEDAIMRIFLNIPRNLDINALKSYWKEGTDNSQQNSPMFNMNGTIWNNPYFVAYENLNGNKRDRLFGNIKISYDILPNLKLTARTGRDFYYDKRTMQHATSSSQYRNGYYQEDDVSFLETNHDVLLTYDDRLSSDFSFNASIGGNLMTQISQRLGAIASRLAIPNVYNLTNNASPIFAGNVYQEKRINSIYGTAQLGFRELVYLDLTGRNDWSSALPKANNSYFYPSASLSVIASQLLGINSEKINMIKIRGAASSVRRDLEPYRVLANFSVSQGWNAQTVAVHNNNFPNPDIRPEKVDSYEFGFDSRFFNNRLGLDVTYYKSITTDLIIPVTLNPSAGYDTKLMNVGKMSNHGLETMLNIVPVRNENFTWNVFINYSFNRNKVLALAEDKGISRIRQLERWASLELRTENTKGDGSFGSLYGDYLIYNESGQLTHRNGLPQEENGDWGYLGNVNPTWLGSISNDFKYKNWGLSFLFAGQKGGVVHSRTYIEGINSGALVESLQFRDADGAGTIVGQGIDIDTGKPNAVAIPVRDYWRAYYNNDRIATFDASYVKLRELKVAYVLSKRLLNHTPVKGASIGLVGRNLLLWSKVPHIDPEVSAYDGQFVGVEAMSLPSMRTYGMSISINF